MRVSHFPGADETVAGSDCKEALDGGKGSHQAIACARLGLPTYFVGRVGADRLGDIGAGWMREAGVDLTYLYRSETTTTGCGFVMINPQGIPAMATAMGANEELSFADIEQAAHLFASARMVIVTFEIPIPIALHAARLAKSLGAFTILTPGPAEILPSDALDGVDLLVPNQKEACILAGQPAECRIEPEKLARMLRRNFNLQNVVITLGDKGAFLETPEVHLRVPAFDVTVADTAGAGDAFTAGLAYGLAQGFALPETVEFGCLAGARAVTIRESIPGFATLSEIQVFAAKHGFRHAFQHRSGANN
jgi:ribokinase